MKIQTIKARQILDSRGNPTLEADVILENGIMGRSAVPSGASTGSREACELRDNGSAYGGKAVEKAVANVRTEIANTVVDMDASDQRAIDTAMIDLDGTPNKSRLGANAILAVSLATAKAAALSADIALFQRIRELSSMNRDFIMPLPLCNVINGGKHASGSTDIQEFMLAPIGARSINDAVRMLSETFHALKSILTEEEYGTTVGDEGGFAPSVRNGNAEAISLLSRAVEKAGYILGSDIVFALDIAATELLDRGLYTLSREGKRCASSEMISWYAELIKQYPIMSIEDGLGEDDWDGWSQMTKALTGTQLVGDDLLVTNTQFLKRGIADNSCNAILVKVNQIGTLTETIDAVDMAHKAGWRAIISHRSGETEDTSISHLAVGLGTGQIKTGSVSRTDRVAKYNELLRIDEMLGGAQYAGNVFGK